MRAGRSEVWRIAGFLVVLSTVAACAGTEHPSSSAAASAPSAGATVSALTFCDPLVIPDLRAPDGSAVVLEGWWAHAGEPDFPTDVVHVFVRQAGDCIWLIETLAFGEDPGALMAASEFHGQLRSDFTVVGEFSKVYGAFPGDPWTYGPFTFVVDVSSDPVELIEDRDPEEPAPGCSGSVGSCPDPLHYVRVDSF